MAARVGLRRFLFFWGEEIRSYWWNSYWNPGGDCILPRSLRSVAGAPGYGAQEKAGHSGRDDRGAKSEERPAADGGPYKYNG